MSEHDPLDALATLDRTVEPRADFADALLERCLAELAPRAIPLRRRSLPVYFAAAAALLVLAAAAAATYLALRSTSVGAPPHPAALTVITAGPQPRTLAGIAVVGSGGRLRRIWHCPGRVFCGSLTSIAWSPDGRHLAMSLGEIGGRSGFIGLHVVDVATGQDHHLGVPAIAHLDRPQPDAVLQRLFRAEVRNLGCPLPHQVAWAPDDKRLAYVCGDDLLRGGTATALYVIGANGLGRFRVRTGTPSAYWPSWSPDGRHLVFATAPAARLAYRVDTNDPVRVQRSSVYVVGVDGSHRTLVAHDASEPAWSPDGKTIAYDSRCGIRLATPAGDDATPDPGQPCAHIGVPGRPAWSPDGSRLAIGTPSGVDVMHADGTGLHRATTTSSGGGYVVGRPAWAPVSAIDALLGRRPQSGF